MQKKIIFFKKYLWILILVLILSAGVFYSKQRNKKPFPTPTPNTQVATYKSILPGQSSEEDLKKELGTPIRTDSEGSRLIDLFQATTGLRNHTAIIENGKVVFVKEIITSEDIKKSDDITKIYGTAPNILYSKYPSASFKLHVYPLNGIAYLGHPDGTLLEVWYFIPMTIDNFINQWGKDYQKHPSTEKKY